MALLGRLKAEFFREPRDGKTVWIPIGFGGLLIVLSVAGSLVNEARGMLFSVSPEFVLLGMAFLLMGGAELLPVDRYRVAGLIRIVTVGVFIAWFGALLLTL